ncbi:Sodium/calcium exchanger [Seminavis robusta]|uniref:Sodium/calcium exchanger n=1 Tax=Seminavis robusta TaxID=568900 RepID=A0A9N8EMH6_9STRA|nr:Sodium/calcium exchanger [Seminavis robusta]|eukprot:Sro1365_g266590.1 Sodium/calcium exchanger (550) ;mRNA; f:23177-25209
MFPSIEPSDVGLTGLLWLFVSYGYVLYYASNLIGEGSELLLLVPSMAGLVGGVVLPVLGAVPDGAIILFSGLGTKAVAQETLAVGVGALAGSTIMLLTVPFAVSIYSGRVDIVNGTPNYKGKPKLTYKESFMFDLKHTGVIVTEPVKHGGIIMAITTIPYFLIQVPALFLHGPTEEVAEGEHWWAGSGMIVCLVGLFAYIWLQLTISKKGEDKGKRIAIMKKLLTEGKVSLSGALKANVEEMGEVERNAATEYQAIQQGDQSSGNYPPPKIAEYLKEVLKDAYLGYDENRNGLLDPREVQTFFRDFHENIREEEMDALFRKFDTDGNGTICFDEFIGMAYTLITEDKDDIRSSVRPLTQGVAEGIYSEDLDGEEEEEVPEDFADLPPDQQQLAIKKRAFVMLTIGTTLVVLFSDPMVDVMQQIATRTGIDAFYVSFVLAPLASNASEVIASQYYAAKKTRKTMTVSLSALEGAASMNNTFCLSIFMGLIYFRGLAWQYTAETLAIVLVEFFMAYIVQREFLTTLQGFFILMVFPLSLVLVAVLEKLGFD